MNHSLITRRLFWAYLKQTDKVVPSNPHYGDLYIVNRQTFSPFYRASFNSIVSNVDTVLFIGDIFNPLERGVKLNIPGRRIGFLRTVPNDIIRILERGKRFDEVVIFDPPPFHRDLFRFLMDNRSSIAKKLYHSSLADIIEVNSENTLCYGEKVLRFELWKPPAHDPLKLLYDYYECFSVRPMVDKPLPNPLHNEKERVLYRLHTCEA